MRKRNAPTGAAPPPPIDWQQLLLNLRSCVSLRQLARDIGRSPEYFSNWTRSVPNKDMPFNVGVALVNAHLDLLNAPAPLRQNTRPRP